MIEDVEGTRKELTDLVQKHYAHTQQGPLVIKLINELEPVELERYVEARKADIVSVNDALTALSSMRKEYGGTLFTPDERALESLASTVDTLAKTASVLKASSATHKNVVALETAAAVIEAIFTTQRDYIRAKRLVMGVARSANSIDKAGNPAKAGPKILR